MKTQFENGNEAAQTHFGIDNTPLSEADGRLTYGAWLLSLECPEVLQIAAKTPRERQQCQSWLHRWKSLGYPNPGAWPKQGCPLPIDRVFPWDKVECSDANSLVRFLFSKE